MRYAFAYGADAVYAGQPRYSLRVRNNEFNHLDNLRLGINEAHSQGKKFYLASNLTPHNNKIKTYIRDLEPVIEMQPDALIMADPGLIMMVRERWPEQEVHLSVQANAVNYATAKFWHRQGISRVILSRELSLDEIAEIKQQCPELELEVFVHGALCIAYSGRCLLSGYMTWRDPNQGACTNSCRWSYKAVEAEENETGELMPKYTVDNSPSTASLSNPEPNGCGDCSCGSSQQAEGNSGDDVPAFLLEEPQRPGELMPAFEDEHGTYIMNSKDLRAVQHVQRLAEIGVESLKIEGRTKSHYYAARTAQVYRQAIDDAVAGRDFNMQLMGDLDGLANRGYTEGFYRRHVPAEYQNYKTGNSTSDKQQFVGEVMSIDQEKKTARIDVKNKFCVGDQMVWMLPNGNVNFLLEELHDKNGKPVDLAPGSGHVVDIALPDSVTDFPETALLIRNL